MNNIGFISTSRVVATLFIVFCHNVKYYTFIPGCANLGELFNVGVPMFIIISGYLYGLKSKVSGASLNYGQFMWHRLKKVSIPVQIFAVLLFLIFGMEQLRHSAMAFLNLQGVGAFFYTDFFDAGPMLSHTWFVTVIIICYLLTPYLGIFIQNKILSKYTLGVLWLLTFLVPFMGFNMCFVTLYITSYYVAAKGINMQISKMLLFFVMALAIACRIGGKMVFDDTVFYDKVIVYITHFLLATSIILFIRELYRSGRVASICDNSVVLKFLDNDSYYIYIVHYSLIPPVYEYFGIVEATILFIALTLVVSVSLRFAHQQVQKVLP